MYRVGITRERETETETETERERQKGRNRKTKCEKREQERNTNCIIQVNFNITDHTTTTLLNVLPYFVCLCTIQTVPYVPFFGVGRSKAQETE